MIVPAFQSAATLARAIESVLGQTIVDIEILIVDDGSSDDTESIVKRLQAGDPRIRYLYQENQGPSAARNTGVLNSSSALVAFLDADDEWQQPTKLQVQVEILESRPDIGLVLTDALYVNTRNSKSSLFSERNRAILDKVIEAPLPSRENAYLLKSGLAANLFEKDFVPVSTVLLRKEAFLRVGGFDLNRRGTEDIDLWVRLAQRYNFAYYEAATSIYYAAPSVWGRDGGKWHLELIRYYKACLDSQEYNQLGHIASRKLFATYRSAVRFYSRSWSPRKALGIFRESLRYGFDPSLLMLTAIAWLGPVPQVLLDFVLKLRKRIQSR